MKILVVGGGGREHALAWKLRNDSSRPDVFCAPGNAGTTAIAANLDIGAEDLDGLAAWAGGNRPDLIVVGPEAPLCAGLADRLEEDGLRVFGPSKAAAQIEGSKVFSKQVMEAAGVPTGRARVVTDTREALDYLRKVGPPVVVKAEGLAAGKGVYICASMADAEQAIREIMVKKVFGAAGSRALIEEFLRGEEASILALIDGRTVVMLASSQDHKRVFDNDQGPNTGGMGAYSPAPVVTDDMWPAIREQVFERTLAELRRRGIVYKGVLYAGLMIAGKVPNVLEFNCRFGDPETQAILPRIASDLLPALLSCVDGTLREDMVRWRKDACVSVVMASGGYPGAYAKGLPIEGLDAAGRMEGVLVFHAGTKLDARGQAVTSGGRVLNVTATGSNLDAAIRRAYLAIAPIRFDQAQYRTDIGAKARRHYAVPDTA
ncbi:MAG: phosphoribosylamine--glycine ligase [Verrucomicrobiota bacterium]|nr:phosphoribosylamine--glycine ligase [Verrucomicrobiota bacterium]